MKEEVNEIYEKFVEKMTGNKDSEYLIDIEATRNIPLVSINILGMQSFRSKDTVLVPSLPEVNTVTKGSEISMSVSNYTTYTERDSGNFIILSNFSCSPKRKPSSEDDKDYTNLDGLKYRYYDQYVHYKVDKDCNILSHGFENRIDDVNNGVIVLISNRITKPKHSVEECRYDKVIFTTADDLKNILSEYYGQPVIDLVLDNVILIKENRDNAIFKSGKDLAENIHQMLKNAKDYAKEYVENCHKDREYIVDQLEYIKMYRDPDVRLRTKFEDTFISHLSSIGLTDIIDRSLEKDLHKSYFSDDSHEELITLIGNKLYSLNFTHAVDEHEYNTLNNCSQRYNRINRFGCKGGIKSIRGGNILVPVKYTPNTKPDFKYMESLFLYNSNGFKLTKFSADQAIVTMNEIRKTMAMEMIWFNFSVPSSYITKYKNVAEKFLTVLNDLMKNPKMLNSEKIDCYDRNTHFSVYDKISNATKFLYLLRLDIIRYINLCDKFKDQEFIPMPYIQPMMNFTSYQLDVPSIVRFLRLHQYIEYKKDVLNVLNSIAFSLNTYIIMSNISLIDNIPTEPYMTKYNNDRLFSDIGRSGIDKMLSGSWLEEMLITSDAVNFLLLGSKNEELTKYLNYILSMSKDDICFNPSIDPETDIYEYRQHIADLFNTYIYGYHATRCIHPSLSTLYLNADFRKEILDMYGRSHNNFDSVSDVEYPVSIFGDTEFMDFPF